ncbi:MAG TPA: DUF72 domain-containing protein, partial [Gemmatimonadaceae bacterium]|nr:DUF72 domain-containing protein [Gemmatimonadaceae bacterium]
RQRFPGQPRLAARARRVAAAATPLTAYYVGCAGWTIPRAEQPAFPAEGSHLERYAARFPAVEINSSFYRPHRPTTYARWGACVPAAFRFAVKVPKAITHERRLADADAALASFLAEASALGERLGCLLVQLPPSLAYEASPAEAFFAALRARHAGAVALEPRHASWFTPDVGGLLERHRVARVAADPARVPAAGEPGGHPETVYFRLHGSPRIYYSAYDEPYLDALAERLRAAAGNAAAVWCIFDNTALGAATANALGLLARLG